MKIPREHFPVFDAALPRDARSSTMRMFGGVAGMVNGHMYAGLWGRSVMVRVGAADYASVLELEGAEPFDPMGKGKPMKDMVLLPEEFMEQPQELRRWLGRALEYTATLPPKKKKDASTAKRSARVPARKKKVPASATRSRR